MLVPSFDPAKDDLQQYTQKVEVLTDVRPSNRMNELVTRLILTTWGAISKRPLKRQQLLTGDSKGVK